MSAGQLLVPAGGMMDEATARVIYAYLMKLPAHGRLVEVGTGFGHSTLFFSQALPRWTIYTVDAFGLAGDGRVWSEFRAENYLKARDHYGGARNVVQILGDSHRVPWELPVDVAYIDAGHTYAACLRDYEVYGTHVKRDGLVIFDDYEQPNNPTNGVKGVVEHLVAHGRLEYQYRGPVAAVLRKLVSS